ncbi:4-hydroxyphenylacetate 3-hydroxylase family protein [Paenibacillus beijingensis]|uniref:4-hydroxyphenylacetate 3-hydroxylase n=1 Tax=Paenibacillus beijingensis TaxID=1126833 RepID=A0A0D5NIM3_9BACL|nr:4-hydroxyphenylacetate 3-hydroxylase N-terminal domain-containing protein [Paenibacillus beijingensis]AJY74773.1 4-hydroxyphenylacetate 3-hydroxylase [Paenibacillus beijingensis]
MPLTRGERFIESLRDGRSVWFEGKRLDDVTAHPAFQGTLDTIRKLFDTLDDKQLQERIGFKNEATGVYAHNAFLVPYEREDLIRRRAAFAHWADETNGVMSRLSEFARSLVTGWYAARHEFTPYDPHFADKITRYYEHARDNDSFLTTALLDPQIDRTKSPGEHRNPDSVLRIVGETEEGVIVRGAKMIATAGPYAHDFLVYPYYRLKETESEYAHFLIVPANLPGLHIVCRDSFAKFSGDDYPLSSKYDEMDAVLFFDDVLVPWERVFLKGSTEGVWKLRMNETAGALAFHQTVVRLLSKLEFVTGVSVAVAQSIGADGFQHVQEKLGELIIQTESIKGLLLASELQSSRSEAGIELPDLVPIETARNLGTRYYPRALEILQLIGAGGFMQVPSRLEELSGPLKDLMHTYYAGKQVGADDKVRLFKLAWDLAGSQLGSRHELYERFYAGDPVRTYANQYVNADKSDLERRMRQFRQAHYGKEAESGEPTIGRQQLSFTPQ